MGGGGWEGGQPSLRINFHLFFIRTILLDIACPENISTSPGQSPVCVLREYKICLNCTLLSRNQSVNPPGT